MFRPGFLVAVIIVLSPYAPQAQPLDAQSRHLPSGPAPVGGYESYLESLVTTGEVVIPGVPAYEWRHGCGPTAAAMVIGYWDGHGCPLLIPGDASTQTDEVNFVIASDGGDDTHYSDYALPLDSSFTGLLPDLSELPLGDEHASHCLADFIRSSWSAAENYYGWSWFSDIGEGIVQYCEYINELHDDANYTVEMKGYHHPDWEYYVEEINAGRPVVLLVDTDGMGGTDHFVTAVGWRDSGGVNEYACFDTWNATGGLRWEPYLFNTSGTPWGIWGGVFCEIKAPVSSVPDNGDVIVTGLEPNHPNPFNPSTRIDFKLAKTQAIRLEVFDPGGHRVKILSDRFYPAGSHSVDWDGVDQAGRAMPSGTYLVRLKTEEGSESRKISLIR